MKKKVLCALLAALLLVPLSACGKRAETPAAAQAPAAAQSAPAIPALPESVTAGSAESAFPLLDAPFSDAETEEMVNHNCARFSLVDVDRYYTRSYYEDGSCCLARYTVVDAVLRDRAELLRDCPAEYLTQSDGRLVFLGETHRVESVLPDGTDRRTELDLPCRSLQLCEGTFYCLTEEGTLLALRGGEPEPLLAGCGWAFVSTQGIFYTALADGRVHLYRSGTRTDLVLTAEAAQTPTVIARRLYYLTQENDGLHLLALDLVSGERFRLAAPLSQPADFIRLGGGWGLRFSAADAPTRQLSVPCDTVFDARAAFTDASASELMRCRGLDGDLRTEELLDANGSPVGTALVLPDGRLYASYAAENPRK